MRLSLIWDLMVSKDGHGAHAIFPSAMQDDPNAPLTHRGSPGAGERGLTLSLPLKYPTTCFENQEQNSTADDRWVKRM